MSVTYTLPSDATVILRGQSNSPSPVPFVPHLLTNTPSEVNFCIRRFPESANHSVRSAIRFYSPSTRHSDQNYVYSKESAEVVVHQPKIRLGLLSDFMHSFQFLYCLKATGTYPIFIPTGGVNNSASSISTKSPNVGGAKTGFDVPQLSA